MTSLTPPRRRWFRFSLRTLFVLWTLAGLLTVAIIGGCRAWQWTQKFEREVLWGSSIRTD